MTAPSDGLVADAVMAMVDQLDRIASIGREALEAVEDGRADGKALRAALHNMALSVGRLAVETEDFR
jgi:hypothetical protein